MSQPVLLFFGYGPNNGYATAKLFSEHNYKVAVAARSLDNGQYTKEGWLQLRIDLSQPEAIAGVFSAVKEAMGTPSVVIYNGAVRRVLPMNDNLSSQHLPDIPQLIADFNVNMVSGLIAAQHAVDGFKQLDTSASRTFIFNANALNEIMLHFVPTFGMAKKGISYMIEAASVAYHDAGFSFYYTDERHDNAAPVLSKWDGPARAELCYKLATEKGRPWQQTYVKGRGYVDFRRQDFEERLRRMDTGAITVYPVE